MHIYVQWTTKPLQGWTRYESLEDLEKIESKPVPSEEHRQGDMREEFDGEPGWIHAVCVQGIIFDEYDHYCIERLGRRGVRVMVWADDEKDWADSRMAIQVDVLPMLRNEEGMLNTNMVRRHWSTPDKRELWTRGGKLRFDFDWFDWSEFVEPKGKVFHGVWMQNRDHHECLRLRERHSWREWK